LERECIVIPDYEQDECPVKRARFAQSW